jgi:hypothetical protein
MKSNLCWVKFKGTHRVIGRQLGAYWAKRLCACENSGYGSRFLQNKQYKERLTKKWSENDEGLFGELFRTSQRYFPSLNDELEGMVEGVNGTTKKYGYTADIKTIFREALGEIDDEKLDCSTIAHRGVSEMSLAHNEMDDSRYPLCYARVRLEKQPGVIRQFLTVSYPFQFFGSAAGANSAIVFTGNSIGMRGRRKEQVRRSLDGRVAKTVFSRMLLEQSRLSSVERLLRRYPAVLPCHWYIATRARVIVYAQIRPRASAKADPTEQLCFQAANQEISCHTNHFQGDRSGSWLWSNRSDRKDSICRLESLETLVGKSGNGPQFLRSHLHDILEKHRKQGENRWYTSASIILNVGG